MCTVHIDTERSPYCTRRSHEVLLTTFPLFFRVLVLGFGFPVVHLSLSISSISLFLSQFSHKRVQVTPFFSYNPLLMSTISFFSSASVVLTPKNSAFIIAWILSLSFLFFKSAPLLIARKREGESGEGKPGRCFWQSTTGLIRSRLCKYKKAPKYITRRERKGPRPTHTRECQERITERGEGEGEGERDPDGRNDQNRGKGEKEGNQRTAKTRERRTVRLLVHWAKWVNPKLLYNAPNKRTNNSEKVKEED